MTNSTKKAPSLKTMRTKLNKLTAQISGESVTDCESALGLITQIPFRDGALRFAFDNPELRENMIQRVFDLFDCASTEYDCATVHTVIAGIAWLDGNKELTETHLEKALNFDSSYSLARLLNVALTHGVPARVWSDSLSAVSVDETLTGAK